jgi:class 3 adenylate cyclase
MHEIDEREKALFKIIQIFCEDFSAVQNGEGEKADRIGLTYNELKARCIQNGLPAGGLLVSVAVDVLGDSGMIKPLTEVRTIQKNAEYFAARSYILGENGGGERSITLPPAFLRREKLQYAIAAIVDGFARHGHPIVSSKMLHKALANLKKDWRNVDLPYEIKASHWGPIAYLVQDDIYEPCSLVEFLGHYCPHVKKSSPYSKLYEVETGWDKDMHGPSMDPSELYAAQGYADVYALLSDVKAEMDCSSSLDGHAHSYNAMLVFSMCRTWQQAYLYCQKATEMWEVDLMYLLSRLKGSKGKSLEAEVRRLSSKCASLRQKLEGYSLLPALKNTVRASPAMRPLSALVDPILGELDDPVRVGHLEEAHKAHSVMSTCTKMLLNTLSGLGLAPDTRSAKEKEEKKLPDYVKEFNEQSQFADPIESSELEGKVLRKDVEGVYGVFSSRFVTVANYLQSNVPRPEVASLQFMERLDEVAQDIFRALESMNLNEASVLFCDLTNYSGLFEGKDTPETTLKVRHLIEALDELVNRILLKYKLGLVKEIYKLKVPQPSGGDAWLICFVTPEDAIVAASEIQQTRNSSGLPPVKMGVARGYVTMYKTNEIGLCINKAQRISQLASPDGICVDGQLVEILKKVQAKEGLAYKDIGEHDLKGVGTLRVSSLDWRSAEVDKWEKHGSVS